MKTTRLLARMGMLIALGVAASYISSISMFGAKLNPAQATVNVVAGALVGPWAAAAVALVIAVMRILLGTGSLLAIPGSVFGALLAGLAYRYLRSKAAAVAGEVIGTGVIGAVAGFPVGVYLMGSAKAAAGGLAFYIPLFVPSSLAGALLGFAVVAVLERYVTPAKAADA